MTKEPLRRYRCASCGETFEHEGKPEKCPFCRCRILILLEGETTRQHPGACAPTG
jgi:DNA-directed RNA polymerase subunit RPC12/RpoP